MHYKCHKINPNLVGSYIASCDWIKNKKTITNPIQSEKVSKIKRFINKCNWKGINFPSGKDDWKKFEKNNVKIALNVFHAKIENIYLAYVSKHNTNR